MAEAIAELEERRKTDRRLSFGLYLVFLLVVIIISAIIGGIGRWVVGFGAGRVISTVVSLLVAIYVWWYNWLLYKRRNEHFDRIKRLKAKLSAWIKEKFDTEPEALTRVDPLLDRREAHHSNLLFGLWLTLSYLGLFHHLLKYFGLFTLAAVIVGLVILYYLTMDYYYHEQGETAFFGRMAEILNKKGISFTVTPTHPLCRRSYGLYIFLSIITLGIFALYWAYVIFRDPNQHFDTHDFWESELERIVKKA
ncbi:MAG: DUF4234 domain-containing protein [Candidatus Aerophobetes bacterium]|nr:DUF4234 domain-containing protein [Candidatus Aerophobetes bacterium]